MNLETKTSVPIEELTPEDLEGLGPEAFGGKPKKPHYFKPELGHWSSPVFVGSTIGLFAQILKEGFNWKTVGLATVAVSSRLIEQQDLQKQRAILRHVNSLPYDIPPTEESKKLLDPLANNTHSPTRGEGSRPFATQVRTLFIPNCLG